MSTLDRIHWVGVVVAAGVPGVAASAPCSEPTPAHDVEAAALAVEAAFIDMDAEGVSQAHAVLASTLPCVDELLDADGAVAVHRAVAWASWVSADDAAAADALMAVRANAPDWQPPPSVAPVGNPLHLLFEQAVPGDEGVPLTHPAGMTVFVDGRPGAVRPRSRSALLQVVSDDELLWTGRLEATAPLPVILRPAPPVQATPRRSPRRRRVVLVSVGSASLVAGGVTYGLARAHQQAWMATDPPTVRSQAELDVLARRTNTLSATSVALLGLGTGLGVAAGVSWTW